MYYLVLALFTLAIDALALTYFFRWSRLKAIGMSLAINVASFLVAGFALQSLSLRLPQNWLQLHFIVSHYATLFLLLTTAPFVVRVAVEYAICRYATVPTTVLAGLAVVAGMNLVTSLPGIVREYVNFRPSVTAPFSLSPRADWIAPSTMPLAFLELPGRALMRSLIGTTNDTLVTTPGPFTGYRMSADGTRFVLCTATGSVDFIHLPVTTNASASLTLALPVSNVALAALSPDARWCATFADAAVNVYSFPDGARTATVATASLRDADMLYWSDAALLVCGTTNAAVSIEWQNATVSPATQLFTAADADWVVSSRTRIATTAVFEHADTRITVAMDSGITVDAPQLKGHLRLVQSAGYAGIGFTPDGSSFVFYLAYYCAGGVFVGEVLGLDLATGAIGHLRGNVIGLAPGVAGRIPPAP